MVFIIVTQYWSPLCRVSTSLICLCLGLVCLLYFCPSLDISWDIGVMNGQGCDLVREERGNEVIDIIMNIC